MELSRMTQKLRERNLHQRRALACILIKSQQQQQQQKKQESTLSLER